MAQKKTGWIEGGFIELVDSFCLLPLEVLHGGEVLTNHDFKEGSNEMSLFRFFKTNRCQELSSSATYHQRKDDQRIDDYGLNQQKGQGHH